MFLTGSNIINILFNFDADFTNSLYEDADKTDFFILNRIKSVAIRAFVKGNQFHPRPIILERPDWSLKPVGSNILNEISI